MKVAEIVIVMLVGLLVTGCQSAKSQQPFEYTQPTEQKQRELQAYVEAYLACGEQVGEEYAASEPALKAEDIVPIAVGRCVDERALLDVKALEIEGPRMAPMMRSFDTTTFRVWVVSAVDKKRRELGI